MSEATRPWVCWTLNDAGLLGRWHALAPDRASTLCGRRVPPPRVHGHELWTPADLGPHRRPACRRCRRLAAKGANP